MQISPVCSFFSVFNSLDVSAYELSKLIPENFKGSLPSIDEIESELRKDTEG